MFHKIFSNDDLAAFHYRSLGTFFLQQKRPHNLHSGFAHYRIIKIYYLCCFSNFHTRKNHK
ncbi:hypothetical protein B7729_04125 [Streptococcus oralis subsp. tigurinus]|uniref:Uncharacterized protein n=1 Tax=Streptococcus oralis subsp. tigurinus TaxID=1077464 RepID=A0A1X1FWV0_STROR|nr:hypothetical protein B7729_04125 [Streptococcus oralis subsp. tigurinus]